MVKRRWKLRHARVMARLDETKAQAILYPMSRKVDVFARPQAAPNVKTKERHDEQR